MKLIESIIRLRSHFTRTSLMLAAVALALTLPAYGKKKTKITPQLQRDVDWLSQNPEYDYEIPVIVRTRGPVDRPAQARDTRLFSGYSGRHKAADIVRLAEHPNVEYIALDAPLTVTFDWVEPSVRAVGAPEVWQAGYEGRNVTVAVFDSGIASHAAFGKGRVVASVDFTGGKAARARGGDEFGHGTAVAGLAGGAQVETFRGVAPGVRFVDVRVIGPDGSGHTSNLISAIEWAVDHKDRYGIRVANFSLGHPPLDSYLDDPLCAAVRGLVAAGVVAVVSAGNLGKTEDGTPVWGGIGSPGLEPSAITVGAVNDVKTGRQSDDVATTYSSRGPTYPDGLFKPDLVAPGNALLSPLAPDSWLAKNLPDRVSPDGTMIRLSGSSMATALVSGAAAAMLEANPNLTPRIVKTMLLLSASKLAAPHFLEQGNGVLNMPVALDMALQLDVASRSVLGGVQPARALEGEAVWAGGAFASGNWVSFGSLVRPDGAAMWGSGVHWPDALAWEGQDWWGHGYFGEDSPVWGPTFVLTDTSPLDGDPGLLSFDDAQLWTEVGLWTQDLVWADGYVWSDGFIWGDGFVWTDSFLWSDAFMWADGFMWTDTFVWSDHAVQASSVLRGDG